MVASERFPAYFDGIVAGDPGFDLPKAAVAEAWNEQALAPLATRLDVNGQPYIPDTFSTADLAVASTAVLNACDALDGLQDGIVDNWQACTSAQVYPALDQVQCQGAKQDGCLSAGQVQALKTIWAGARITPTASRSTPTGSGTRACPAPPRCGSGRSAPRRLPGQPLVNNALNLTLGGGSLPLVFITPPVVISVNDLAAYVLNFSFDTDAPKIYATSPPYDQSSMDLHGRELAQSPRLPPARRQDDHLSRQRRRRVLAARHDPLV